MYGVQIAFRRFNATAGITKSPWVGMYYFERFFNSPYFASTIKNTLILSLYGLVVSFPIPIILALMLNSFRHKRYRKVIQTVTYAPNFISTVVMCGMIILFLSPSVGVINHVLEAIGIPAVNFMAKKAYWRHIYVWTGVWQSTGWSSVIYFAALAGISPELHEAAKVDGATKLQLIHRPSADHADRDHSSDYELRKHSFRRLRKSLPSAEQPECQCIRDHFHLRL